MPRFQNILLVVDGLSADADALKQALSQARNNQAELSVLLLPPSLPPAFADRQDVFEKGLVEQVRANLAAAAKQLRLDEATLTIDYRVERGDRPTTLAIRDVLRNRRDLIVKQAAPVVEGTGFTAADFELLRKCPVPVWLCRPIADPREVMQVAVAVEPQASHVAAQDLALDLLKLGRRLADECNGRLMVISAWDCPYESSLRHSAFIKISDAEVAEEVERTRRSHQIALQALLAKAAIGDNVQVEHRRGVAADVVTERVESAGIDILVMGTIARTGVAGLLIGNTAENVLRRLPCSLVALKPAGFVSPIKIG
jgi:nucleotide-binding universal stress UspA family protein